MEINIIGLGLGHCNLRSLSANIPKTRLCGGRKPRQLKQKRKRQEMPPAIGRCQETLKLDVGIIITII